MLTTILMGMTGVLITVVVTWMGAALILIAMEALEDIALSDVKRELAGVCIALVTGLTGGVLMIGAVYPWGYLIATKYLV